MRELAERGTGPGAAGLGQSASTPSARPCCGASPRCRPARARCSARSPSSATAAGWTSRRAWPGWRRSTPWPPRRRWPPPRCSPTTSRCAFRHPVVHASVLRAMPPWSAPPRTAGPPARSRPPAPRASPPSSCAAPPAGDAWVVERLREAAATARARARRRPPPGSGAARSPSRPRRTAAPRCCARPAPPRSPRARRTAWRCCGPPPRRSRTARARRRAAELAAALFDRRRAAEAAAVARAALARLDGRDRELDLQLRRCWPSASGWTSASAATRPSDLRRRVAGLRGATPMERFARATVAMMDGDDTAAGHARAAAGLEAPLEGGDPGRGCRRRARPPARCGPGGSTPPPGWPSGGRAGALGGGAAAPRGDDELRGWLALDRGRCGRRGRPRGGVELGAEVALPGPRRRAAGLVVAGQGRGEDAAATSPSTGSTASSRAPGDERRPVARAGAAVRARRDAAADALELGRRYARWGLVRAVPPWRSQAAVAGRGDRPAPAARSRGAGARAPLGHAVGHRLALRGCGLVHGDAGRLAEAVDRLAESPARLELARAPIELGAALRRTRRRADARAPLEPGWTRRMRWARSLAARGRVELRAAGARPRRHALSGVASLNGQRAAGGGARGGRSHQPGDRPGAVRHGRPRSRRTCGTSSRSSTCALGARCGAALAPVTAA